MSQLLTWSNFGFLHVLKSFRPILYMFIHPFHDVLQTLFIYNTIYPCPHQRPKSSIYVNSLPTIQASLWNSMHQGSSGASLCEMIGTLWVEVRMLPTTKLHANVYFSFINKYGIVLVNVKGVEYERILLNPFPYCSSWLWARVHGKPSSSSNLRNN